MCSSQEWTGGEEGGGAWNLAPHASPAVHVPSPETEDRPQREEYSVLVASMLEPAVVYR